MQLEFGPPLVDLLAAPNERPREWALAFGLAHEEADRLGVRVGFSRADDERLAESLRESVAEDLGGFGLDEVVRGWVAGQWV